VIAGIEGSEDAGVYRISDDLALVQTLDFFTPIVDDARVFGRAAAANSLSDVYAMGGRPITAMNIVCFPIKALGLETLRDILEGGWRSSVRPEWPWSAVTALKTTSPSTGSP